MSYDYHKKTEDSGKTGNTNIYQSTDFFFFLVSIGNAESTTKEFPTCRRNLEVNRNVSETQHVLYLRHDWSAVGIPRQAGATGFPTGDRESTLISIGWPFWIHAPVLGVDPFGPHVWTYSWVQSLTSSRDTCEVPPNSNHRAGLSRYSVIANKVDLSRLLSQGRKVINSNRA